MSISEHDLLALIEGELPPDRIDAVRRALREDRALLRRVEAMVRDRRLLAAQPAGLQPPRDLVGSAIERAERELLVTGPLTKVEPQAIWRRRSFQMAMAACLLFAVVGSWTLIVLSRVGPAHLNKPIIENPLAGQELNRTMADVDDDDPAKGFTDVGELYGPPLPGEALAFDEERPAESEIDFDPTRALEQVNKARLAQFDESDGTSPGIGAWTDDDQAAELFAAAGRGGAWEQRVSLEEAAVLAMEGRLRIVVIVPDSSLALADPSLLAMSADPTRAITALSEEQLSPDGADLARPESAPEKVPSVAPPVGGRIGDVAGRYLVDVTFDEDTGETGLRQSLESLIRDLHAPGLRAVALVPSGDEFAGEGLPSPSLDVEDVVWWSRPPAEWSRRSSLPVIVESVVGPQPR